MSYPFAIVTIPIPPAYQRGGLDLDGHQLVSDLVALDLPLTAETVEDMRESNLDQEAIDEQAFLRQHNMGSWLTAMTPRFRIPAITA